MTTKEFAAKHGVNLQRVKQWLADGRIVGAYKSTTPRGDVWVIPNDAPRPEPLPRGNPNWKKQP